MTNTIPIKEKKRREAIRRTSLKRWQNIEYRERVILAMKKSAPWKGKKLPEETIKKMREAHKGQIAWNKNKKMPVGMAQKMSEIGKQKINEKKQLLERG